MTLGGSAGRRGREQRLRRRQPQCPALSFGSRPASRCSPSGSETRQPIPPAPPYVRGQLVCSYFAFPSGEVAMDAHYWAWRLPCLFSRRRCLRRRRRAASCGRALSSAMLDRRDAGPDRSQPQLPAVQHQRDVRGQPGAGGLVPCEPAAGDGGGFAWVLGPPLAGQHAGGGGCQSGAWARRAGRQILGCGAGGAGWLAGTSFTRGANLSMGAGSVDTGDQPRSRSRIPPITPDRGSASSGNAG